MIDIEKYKDYVQSESPNKGRISTIVNNIKGNRTAAVYASDIGLNAARISRIINGVYSNALDFDTLVKLADGNEFYLERLLSANGTLSPKELEEKNLRSDFQELKIERQKREDTFLGIHRKAFIDFLYMVRILLKIGNRLNDKVYCFYASLFTKSKKGRVHE